MDQALDCLWNVLTCQELLTPKPTKLSAVTRIIGKTNNGRGWVVSISFSHSSKFIQIQIRDLLKAAITRILMQKEMMAGCLMEDNIKGTD